MPGLAERFAGAAARLGAARQAVRAFQPPLLAFLNARPKLYEAVHGRTWLGHPLHPVLTDVPIGAWTLAAVFDSLPRTEKAADVCVAVGLAGALPTAIAGVNDWSRTSGPAARIGAVHASFNIAATICFAASLASRPRNRKAGVVLQFAGNGLATLGAMLGGHLVYDEGLGVKARGSTEEASGTVP